MMPANYAVAKQVQVFRSDVEDLLLLSSRVIFATSSSSSSSSSSSNSTTTTTTATSASDGAQRIVLPFVATVGGVLEGVLAEAHLRGLVVDGLVRVTVPKTKQESLLETNPYVQLWKKQKKSQRNAEGDSASAAGSSSRPAAASGESSAMTHRVGRVVALLPKPGKGGAGSNTVGSSAESVASQWLMAVHLGECVELFATKFVSNEVFTEAEHRVYVQSTLGSAFATATPPVGSGNSSGGGGAAVTPNTLQTAEQAEATRKALDDLRRTLRLVQSSFEASTDTANGTTSTGSSALLPPAQQQWLKACGEHASRAVVSGVKRRRATQNNGNEEEEDEEDEADGMGHRSHGGASTGNKNAHSERSVSSTAPADGDFQESAEELARVFAGGDRSLHAHIERLTELSNLQATQLRQLRQQLNAKDGEVKQHVQLQRQSELDQAAEIARWRAKVEEGSVALDRERTEAAAKLTEKDTLLQQANTKLRHLAEMTTRYKKVCDEVVRVMGIAGSDGGDGGKRPVKPEEVLAALQKRQSL